MRTPVYLIDKENLVSQTTKQNKRNKLNNMWETIIRNIKRVFNGRKNRK